MRKLWKVAGIAGLATLGVGQAAFLGTHIASASSPSAPSVKQMDSYVLNDLHNPAQFNLPLVNTVVCEVPGTWHPGSSFKCAGLDITANNTGVGGVWTVHMQSSPGNTWNFELQGPTAQTPTSVS